MTEYAELLRSARDATDGEHPDDYDTDSLRRLVSLLADAVENVAASTREIIQPAWVQSLEHARGAERERWATVVRELLTDDGTIARAGILKRLMALDDSTPPN